MARKREDKTNKVSRKAQKSRPSSDNACQDKNFLSLKHQLSAIKLTLREIPGDGNCLFGALADQLDGTPKTHMKHRQDVVAYMRNHRQDFEPFVEDDEPFEKHLSNLAELGTYGGNECIVAFARLNIVKVVIHQLNTPLWQIDGSDAKDNVRELHISYHNGDHYNSVRRTGDCTSNPSNIKLSVKSTSRDEGGSGKKKKSFEDDKNLSYYFESVCEPYGECTDEMVACSGEDETTMSHQSCQHIMERTGYEDVDTIHQFLVANRFDVNDTVDAVLNFIILERKGELPTTVPSSWDPDDDQDGESSWGEESEKDCDQETYDREPLLHSHTSTSSSSHTQRDSSTRRSVSDLQEKLKNSSLSSARKKELKKQLRKQQRSEKKRHQAASTARHPQTCSSSSTEDPLSCWGGEGGEDHSETIIVRDIACLSI